MDATFVPWLWASVNRRWLAAIISGSGTKVAVQRPLILGRLCAPSQSFESVLQVPESRHPLCRAKVWTAVICRSEAVMPTPVKAS